MLRDNSPTLQKMIESVKPGEGNFAQTAPVYQGQFYSPYPSPKDMVMQSAINPYGQNIMPGFQIPGNTIAMINGVPTELEFRPYEVSNPNSIMTERYVNIPGAPTNPNMAHLSGQNTMTPMAGRYMPSDNNSIYGQARTSMLSCQQNIVGGYNPYPSYPNSQYSQPFRPQIQGYINIYNGQLIHPHVNEGWYGSPEYPFENNSKKSLSQNNLSDIMRDRFNQKFPGYSNPYMVPGFMQSTVPQIPAEVQDMANLAAFYGMSYEEFISNGSSMMKKMSRHASKYLGCSEEEAKIREKFHDLKPINKPGEVPDNDDELFYPSLAFNFNGGFTREYQEMYCVDKERLKKAKKTIKVTVIIGGQEIECKSRNIDFVSSRDQLDRSIISNTNYYNWLQYNKVRFDQMYWSAPERKIDHLDGTVFQIASKSIAFARQAELERELQHQRYTMSSLTFNRDEFITKIKSVRERSKANAKAIADKKFSDMIHQVARAKPGQDLNIPIPEDKPYICDGDWVIAKPGVDIVGLPLDQSVNKIIRINVVTGEEEIYDPSKMMGIEVRERIKEAMKPSFDQINDDELEERLKRFKNAGFLNHTD